MRDRLRLCLRQLVLWHAQALLYVALYSLLLFVAAVDATFKETRFVAIQKCKPSEKIDTCAN